MTTPVLLEAKGLRKYFDMGKGKFVHAVDDINLKVHEQEIVGLVGESGSGKSTFGKTILGLHDKTAGDVFYEGERLPDRYTTADFNKYARKMQMIFQDPYSSLNPRMTVGELIGEGLKLHSNDTNDTSNPVVNGITRWFVGGYGRFKSKLGSSPGNKQITERTADWLERVGLQADHMSRYPHEFSGGQRQRIGIARALIMEPDFVVCDEPISALDVSVQAQVVNLLDELKSSMGLTLLFIAHDLSMVRYVSDRMAVMYLGSLVEVGPADEVFFNPLHPYTEVLIGSNPEPDPESERKRPSTAIQGEIPSPINVPAGCRFANRCPKVMEQCHTVTPEMIPLAQEPHRQVACHLYNA